MTIADIMTRGCTCCTPEDNLGTVARLMKESDCGLIPVVSDLDSMHLRGVITDRDIICRIVADGRNPLTVRAKDAMTSEPATVNPGASVDEAVTIMEEHRVRRLPVVDERRRCIGIVAQADLALKAPEVAAEVLKQVSEPLYGAQA